MIFCTYSNEVLITKVLKNNFLPVIRIKTKMKLKLRTETDPKHSVVFCLVKKTTPISLFCPVFDWIKTISAKATLYTIYVFWS